MSGKYSQRTGITRFNVLVSDQLSIGSTVTINEDNNGTIKGQKIVFTQLRGQGDELVYTNNSGELREINSAESGEASNDLILTQKDGSSPIEYIWKNADDIGSGMTPTGSYTISGSWVFSTTPRFSALTTNGFMRTSSSNGTISSSALVTADLPSTIDAQLVSTNFLNIVSLLSSNDKYYVDYSGSGDKMDFHHVETTGGGDVTTDILSLSKSSFQFHTSTYQQLGLLNCSASGEITSYPLTLAQLPTGIPNSNLANSSITLGSSSVALGATQTTNTTYTELGGDNVVINVASGETFTWRQGSAGGSSSGWLELYCSGGSINRLVTFSPLGGVVFTSAIASDAYGEGILHSNASGQISSSALTTDELPDDIPNSKLENSTITINGSSVALGGSTSIASGFPFTIGSTSISGSSSNSSLSGITDISLSGEINYDNDTNSWKTIASIVIAGTTKEYLATKYGTTEIDQIKRESSAFVKTNRINQRHQAYNNFDTDSLGYKAISILPSMFSVCNEDQGAGNITPVYILRVPSSTNSNKVKFSAMHESSSVELYWFYQLEYGYTPYSVRINTYKESDVSEDNENLKIFRYYTDDTALQTITSTQTTNSTYIFDGTLQATDIANPINLVFQIDTTSSVCTKGGTLLLKSLI